MMPYCNKAIKNRKLNTDTVVGILCLFFVVLMTSLVVASLVIPKSLAAQVTMEVYQQADGKAFGKETSLDIFNNEALEGEKLAAPFTTGSYTFAVYNSAASNLLPYSLSLVTSNPDDIPLVFSLQKNGEYIYGGASDAEMIPLTEFDSDDVELNGKQTDLYTINWRWNTSSDESDTALGTLAAQRDLIYKLTVTATGTISEDGLPNGGGGTNGNNAANGIINKIIGHQPKTGDNASVLLWIVLALGAFSLIILLIYKRRRKKKDENE